MVPPGQAPGRFFEQLPAALSAFAVQDVAKRRHGVAAAEVSLQQVACDE